MAVFGGVNGGTITDTVVTLARSTRDVLTRAGEVHAFLAGLSLADLQGLGMSAGDAQAILNASADLAGLADLYSTGTDHRNPGAGYVYAASSRAIVGPL